MGPVPFILLAVLVSVIPLIFLLRQSNPEPKGWTALTDGKSYGTDVDPTGSFDFSLAPNGVHYVTKACSGIPDTATTITLHYRIDADPGVTFCPNSDPKAPSIGPTLYFQRKGDDWSGQGKYETYRWWATFVSQCPMTPGEHTITASLEGCWSAVETTTAWENKTAFRDALVNAARVGFTFGGGTGYGHGVFATGKARFTLLSFEIQ